MALATKQSEKSRQTDVKVSLSAAKAVREVGVDQMALTRVAADAGFSSGAIYARCDDRSELVVLSWEKCFWPMLSDLIGNTLDAVLDGDQQRLADVMTAFSHSTAPDANPDLGSAMEVIIASRRDEVIGEVVQRDFAEILSSRGVGPGTEGSNRQAAIGALASIFGAALINSAYVIDGLGPVDPRPLLATMCDPTKRPTAPAAAKKVASASVTTFEPPTTYDEVRDALIAATEYVIARSGVHRATISRIARRAGVSVGAIYGLYDNKESLVRDCVEILFPPQSKRDAADWASVFSSSDPHAAVSSILSNYMADQLAQWRRFRLETLVAARHTPSISRQLVQYANLARQSLTSAVERSNGAAKLNFDTSISARASITGLAIMEIADPTITQLDWRWVPMR